MPELPEVETIRIGLGKKIVGLKLLKIDILTPKSLQGNQNLIEKKKVINIWRRAKVLGIELENNVTILVHLKMTGQLILIQNSKLKIKNSNEVRLVGGHPTQDMRGSMPNKSTRVIFIFSDGSKLFFNDQRRFGWVKIGNLKSDFGHLISGFGPEPLDKDFTWELLKQRILRRKSVPVKVAIMDQEVIAGVGNIYAAEACFNAKLNPRKKVGDLSDQDFKSLHRGVVKALRDGIKHGGSSRAHFVNADGDKGYFLDYAFVYGRDKQDCKLCKTKLEKIKLGGRGTVFCPVCQN